MGAFMLSPESGAETMVHLASSAEVEAVTGKYFVRSRPRSSSSRSRDVELARRLWQVSEGLTHKWLGRPPSPEER
jgi:hypothetical protein